MDNDSADTQEERWIIEQLGAGGAGAASSSPACPDAGELAAYLDGKLSSQATDKMELHLAGCAHCREIALLARDAHEGSAAVIPEAALARAKSLVSAQTRRTAPKRATVVRLVIEWSAVAAACCAVSAAGLWMGRQTGQSELHGAEAESLEIRFVPPPPAGRIRDVKQHLPWILLLLSLCFNAFFMYGFVQSRRQIALASTKEGMVELAGERLGLSAGQRQLFEKTRADMELKIQASRAAKNERMEAFWAAVAAESPDPAVALELFGKADDERKENNRLQVLGLIEVLKILDPGQRTLYLKMIRGHSVFAR